MPKAPRSPEGEAPKKRIRKVAAITEAATETTTKAPVPVEAAAKKPKAKKPVEAPVEIPVAQLREVVATGTQVESRPTSEVLQMKTLEERVRIRAYELYLRRGGRGGSPEQDWFQAMAEVYRESVA